MRWCIESKTKMKTYTPRSGSTGDRAIQILQEHGSQASPELAKALDVSQHNLTNNLALCVKNGLIKGELIKNVMTYSLGDSGAPEELETEVDAEGDTQDDTEPFNAARYMDGDLVIMGEGVEPVEGGFVIRAHCVPKLEAYMSATRGMAVALSPWVKPEDIPKFGTAP
jgi:hypothetical protein